MDKGTIEKHAKIHFQGGLFSLEKDSSEGLVILYLSRLIKHIQCDKFKMVTVAHVRTLLPHGAYTCSLDLSDTYRHVPVAKKFRLLFF